MSEDWAAVGAEEQPLFVLNPEYGLCYLTESGEMSGLRVRAREGVCDMG